MRFLAPAGAVFVLALALSATACRKRAAPPPPASASSAPRAAEGYGPLNQALPRLPTLKLWLGNQELTAEVARAPVEVQTGMMFRTNIASNEGMLFVFGRPFRVSFYMRNTVVPLSCAYIDPDGVIQEIHDLKPRDETPVWAGSDNIQYVLETAQGWFQRNGIGAGTVVRAEQGVFPQINWATLRVARPR
jgi:uncharacterized membrane protein (UPF0127 family)